MGYLTGGPINLKKGWAVVPFQTNKAHFMEEDTVDAYIDKGGRVRFYRTLCGMEVTTDDKRPALEPGNWPKCKRCMNISKH